MNPVLVNLWRGSAIESRHRGAVAVVDATGRLVHSLGDIERPEFPRSSIKFLQAVPFVESGAVEHFALGDRHIALSCASHNGENIHTDTVSDWLGIINCSNDDLECGAEPPLNLDARADLTRAGATVQRIHHNCSGKHLGMLSTIRHLGETTKDYRLYKHPVQQRWFAVIEELSGVRTSTLPWGYDGCGIPTLAMPLEVLARALGRFANAEGVSSARAVAMDRIMSAIAAEPYMVAGADRLCTALISLTGKNVLVKTGAEGYYTAVVADRGYGIAIKADDGQTRASQVMLGAVLRKLGALSDDQYQELKKFVNPDLTNSRNEVIGAMEPAPGWDEVWGDIELH